VLSPLKPATVASGANPVGIAISPDGGSLYVVDSALGGGTSAVSQYSIGAGGKLSPKTPETVATGGEPRQVAVSPDGKSVYVSNLREKGEISQYTVEPGGALTPKSPASVAAERQPEGLAISPDGKNLYVTETISNTVSQYRIEANGNLTLLASAHTGEDPRSIAFASKTQLLPPTVETKAASSVTQTTATLNATVNPNGGTVGECTLEYGTTTAYGSIAPCLPSPGSGESPVAVSASVSGLSPNTTYHLRVSATNAAGTSKGSDETLKTICSAGGFCASFTPEKSEGSFNQPDAVALDPSGDIWVADSGNDRVLEFNKERKFLRQFGTEGIGAGQYEGIAGNGIAGIATNSSGDVYVTGSDRVQEFSPTGEFLRQWGSPGSGTGQFLGPNGIAVDGSGNVWVLDTFNYRVQEFSESGAYLGQFGSEGTGNGQLGWASGLAFSGGNLYVADSARVQEFSTAGAYLTQFGSSGTANGQFHGLGGIASDPTTGNLYVTDTYNNRVQEFTAAGAFIAAFGSGGSGNGQFSFPRGVAVNSSGTFYVADTGNNRMEEWVGTP
jgi:DNA-binding beta-propeller fold protein YncE